MLRLQKEQQRTIIFISHDLDEAIRIGDRIAIMEGGRVVQVGTPDEILLRDITDDTCSWLKVEPGDDHTTLWFGSGLRRPNRIVVRAQIPAHRFYARLLLRGAIGMLGTPPR